MFERRHRIDNSLNHLLLASEKSDQNDPEQSAFCEAVQAVGEADLRLDNPQYNHALALELLLKRISPALLGWKESIELHT